MPSIPTPKTPSTPYELADDNISAQIVLSRWTMKLQFFPCTCLQKSFPRPSLVERHGVPDDLWYRFNKDLNNKLGRMHCIDTVFNLVGLGGYALILMVLFSETYLFDNIFFAYAGWWSFLKYAVLPTSVVFGVHGREGIRHRLLAQTW